MFISWNASGPPRRDRPPLHARRSGRPPEAELDATLFVLVWRSVSSELFANLFEDWMRGDRSTINWGVGGHPGSSVRVDLLPEASAGSVREQAYVLFEQGLDQRLVPLRSARTSSALAPRTPSTCFGQRWSASGPSSRVGDDAPAACRGS